MACNFGIFNENRLELLFVHQLYRNFIHGKKAKP